MHYTLPKDTDVAALVKKGAEAVRATVISQAVDYMLACGTPAEDCMKIMQLFHGGPLALIRPEIYISSIDRFCLGLPDDPKIPGEISLRDIPDRVQGKFTVPGTDMRKAYDIQLRDSEQTKFVVAVIRKGVAQIGQGVGSFPSLSIVIPEVEGPHVLNLRLDVYNNSKELQAGFSSIYRPRRQDGNGQMQRENRLRNLSGLTNLPQIALDAAIAAGFPIESIRVNRSDRETREAMAMAARYGNTPVAAGRRSNGSEGSLREMVPQEDPFGED